MINKQLFEILACSNMNTIKINNLSEEVKLIGQATRTFKQDTREVALKRLQ